ncbi:DUF1294 domain-containing protein [Shewanella sp. OMA3-2]|uniref:DUF1294 domain-containing protein n=1 Tax=Shewanella sp. OMA3-2 TaxID=2908650 RepID=UPI001F2672F3|nr:DUF1294 domain-containing protein [Shewanella sp. OMA3-2]UJF21575.1 DUF1294 domain-containing protein [Shewanella sp. OMA3-2]
MMIFAIVMLGVWLVLLAVGYGFYALSPWVIGVFVGLNLLSFIVTWYDKRVATHNQQASTNPSSTSNQRSRISEKTLYIYALLGGWPAAIIAQQHFRHKTQKNAFKYRFWLSIFANILLTIGISYLYLLYTV